MGSGTELCEMTNKTNSDLRCLQPALLPEENADAETAAAVEDEDVREHLQLIEF